MIKQIKTGKILKIKKLLPFNIQFNRNFVFLQGWTIFVAWTSLPFVQRDNYVQVDIFVIQDIPKGQRRPSFALFRTFIFLLRCFFLLFLQIMLKEKKRKQKKVYSKSFMGKPTLANEKCGRSWFMFGLSCLLMFICSCSFRQHW